MGPRSARPFSPGRYEPRLVGGSAATQLGYALLVVNNGASTPPSGPGQRGYWFGAAAVLLGACLGVGLLTFSWVSAVRSLPTFESEFGGSHATVTVSAPPNWAIYVQSPAPDPGGCTVVSDAGYVPVPRPTGALNLHRNGSEWTWLGNVNASHPGIYQVRCAAGHYAVGEQPHLSGFAFRIVSGVLGLIVPPLFGLGIPLIVVTAARRSGARRPQVA
jgi:hypothetical protein